MLKVCFVGLGSIGKRHLRNLSDILCKRGVEYIFDAIRSTDSCLPDDIQSKLKSIYYTYEDAPSDYDIIFITNPTIKHFEAIKELSKKTKNIFIEKPLFEKTEGYSIEDLKLGNGIYYIACPMRYESVYYAIKEYVNTHCVFSARAICSTYLPEWRPEQDYRKVYSARRELGGGVGTDLIHEWDYLVDLFGIPVEVHDFHGTYSGLEITSDDLYTSIARYKDKIVELHLDYFGRIPKRNIELYTDDDTVIGDFINNTFTTECGKKIEKYISDGNTAHYKELEVFLDMCDGKAVNTNTVQRSYNVLALTEGKIY